MPEFELRLSWLARRKCLSVRHAFAARTTFWRAASTRAGSGKGRQRLQRVDAGLVAACLGLGEGLAITRYLVLPSVHHLS